MGLTGFFCTINREGDVGFVDSRSVGKLGGRVMPPQQDSGVPKSFGVQVSWNFPGRFDVSWVCPSMLR